MCEDLFYDKVATFVTQRKSSSPLSLHSMMKQPRLPGTEKFKFASSDKPLTTNHISLNNSKYRLSSISHGNEHNMAPSHYVFHSRTSSISSQNELKPMSATLSVPTLNRSDSKRRAVLPITCKKTSRMLTNTNVELTVDPADLSSEDNGKSSRRNLDSTRIPSCPNLETSSRSLNSSKTSLDTYFRKMSLQNPTIRELPPDFDWKNIRASPSRLSASCSSSCSSEENVWVLREDS
ncbi:uncharacterized protein CEXT_602611 [Caerostris extrusa]|uniref:Uncharacterized protein n=1 Tax=Caerostris extrusa TaxID=172846 RepID=A0AAV4XMI4_CAEEX|nr:uncharacterized protein CEXT_602611 [Caerostris extrusa]